MKFSFVLEPNHTVKHKISLFLYFCGIGTKKHNVSNGLINVTIDVRY
jgi:hypothetical protein